MSTSTLVGPLLGFEAGDIYSVCVLLEPGLAPALNISGSAQPIAFAKAATVGDNEFWRAEFAPGVPAAAMDVKYSITANGAALSDRHGRAEWIFHVPGPNDRPIVAYASCNGFSSAKLAANTTQQYLMWEKMADQHSAAPFSLLLMGGDQLYADEIWESKRCPSLKKWGDLDWEEQNKAKVSATLSKEIKNFYDWIYTDRWQDKHMSLMLASIPSIMMWDDHDIFDGWGSFPDERQDSYVFQEIFSHASRVFDVFQHRCSTRNRLNPAAAHRSLGLKFRNFHILVLDNRTERRFNQIMSEQHWTDTKQWLNNLANDKVENLWVMAGVPAVYRSFSTVESIIDFTPWHEEVEDDVHDHWSSRPHLAERMRFIMVLLNFLEAHRTDKTKAVILSGDVHVGGIGQFWNDRKQLGITQLISSGIVHPPPSAFQWAGIQIMTSDDPESIGDGDVVAEMLTPFGGPKYLRCRNYATLQTGTDSKLWINWVCQEEKWKPNFAVS